MVFNIIYNEDIDSSAGQISNELLWHFGAFQWVTMFPRTKLAWSYQTVLQDHFCHCRADHRYPVRNSVAFPGFHSSPRFSTVVSFFNNSTLKISHTSNLLYLFINAVKTCSLFAMMWLWKFLCHFELSNHTKLEISVC